ncbi:hypothetical protein MBLNU459_g1805t1 [Dothideomycetes sp. NU459]
MALLSMPTLIFPAPPVLISIPTASQLAVHSTKSVAAAKPKDSAKPKLKPTPTPTPKPKPAKEAETKSPRIKYLYPKKSTCIHVIRHVKVWEHGSSRKFLCRVFRVPVLMSVGELIENLMGKEGDACTGWAVTEVTEMGDGVFAKGTTVEFVADRARGPLSALGWDEGRGSSRPPVWLVLHKS